MWGPLLGIQQYLQVILGALPAAVEVEGVVT